MVQAPALCCQSLISINENPMKLPVSQNLVLLNRREQWEGTLFDVVIKIFEVSVQLMLLSSSRTSSIEIASYLSSFAFTELARVCQEDVILQALLRAGGILWLKLTAID